MEKSRTDGVSITLTPEKSEEFFYTALCDGLGVLAHYDLEFVFGKKEYELAKEHLTAMIENGVVPREMQRYDYPNKKPTRESIYYEDVLMQILRSGGKLSVIDHNGGEYSRSITIYDVHKRVQKTPFRHLSDMIEERMDATTADVILQTVFFKDIIFG